MNLTFDKIVEIKNQLPKIQNIKKTLKEKFCPNLNGHYNNLIMILPEAFKGSLPNYDWIIYNRYAKGVFFINNKNCI